MESFLQGSFAIAVAAFLLIRMEHQLAALTQAIALLRHCQTCRLSPWKTTMDAPDEYEDEI